MAFRLGGRDLVGNCRTPMVDFAVHGPVISIPARPAVIAYPEHGFFKQQSHCVVARPDWPL
jgi:hypothetical protein